MTTKAKVEACADCRTPFRLPTQQLADEWTARGGKCRGCYAASGAPTAAIGKRCIKVGCWDLRARRSVRPLCPWHSRAFSNYLYYRPGVTVEWWANVPDGIGTRPRGDAPGKEESPR